MELNLGQKLFLPRPLPSAATAAVPLVLVLLERPDKDGIVVGLDDDAVDLPDGVEVGEARLVVDVVPGGDVDHFAGEGVRRLPHHAHEVELRLLEYAHRPADGVKRPLLPNWHSRTFDPELLRGMG